MPKLITGFCALLLLVVFTPTTQADPLVITGGTLTVIGSGGGPTFTFTGENFVLGGAGGEPGASAPQLCRPCSGSISVFSNFAGSSLGGGGITINGMNFFGPLGGSFEFRGDPILLPAGTSNVIVSGPFTFSGSFLVCGSDPCQGPIIFSTQLVGSGHVMIDLLFNPLSPPGVSLYDFRSVTYVFENPAVPEPASIVLLISGLVAVGAHRKFRFRKRP
ncbi:MAG TPA: PEP-CTERM sorting domain-containing protein [Pyrinomonadaceae bacterium]|nr:PEP-CTERM sorting domain-containing protein [Pyrinomonadaceae bacterium]